MCDDASLSIPGEAVALRAELERLAAVPFCSLQQSDTQRVSQLLYDVDRKNEDESLLCRGTPAARPAGRAAVEGTTGTAPSRAARQRRLELLRGLAVEHQDALMRVLYACMAAAPYAGPPKEGAAGLRAVYEWHAALYEVAGDGAVVRVLASR